MISDAHTVLAATRPLRSEPADVVPSRRASARVGAGGGPDRASLSSRGWGMGPASDSLRSALPSVVHEFTAAWERGDSPSVEDYLRRLDADDGQGAVDLIYREFCLAESDGRAPVA